jgi:hypothetical protein
MMEIKSTFTGRRGVSLPFTDSLTALVKNNEDMQRMWVALVDYAEKSRWRYIDLRGDFCRQEGISVFDSFYQHDIQLQADEQMFPRFSHNNRRNIKKSVNEGVEVEVRQDLKSVKEFYTLNSLTRKRHGLPSQPYKFFENIYKYIICDGSGIVVMAKKNGEVVAGSIYFLFGNKAIYKYGASNKEERYLRANNLVMWEAIKWLSSRDYKSLNLGRTDKNNEGLIRYKNGWGTVQNSVDYYRYSLKESRFLTKEKNLSSIGTRFFKAAPVSVSNFLGGVLYKHVG